MNDTLKEKLMDRIAKLITLSKDDGATENEKEVAATKAAELMAKYNIHTMSTKTKEDLNVNAVEELTVNLFYGHKGSRVQWEGYLAVACSKPFGCKVVRVNGDVIFFGMPEDLELCIYFFNHLQMEIDVESHEQYPKHSGKRNMFGRGMVSRVSERLQDMYRKVQEIVPSDCRALVVVKDQAVANRFKQRFPHTTKTPSKARYDMDAYNKGRIAGNKVDLSSNRTQIQN